MPGDTASLSYPRVRAIALDAHNAAWVATGNGALDRIDTTTGAIERRLRGTPGSTGYLTAVLPESRDRIWLGDRNGLVLHSLAGGAAVELPVELTRADALPPPGYVVSLVRARDGNVWAAARGGGVALVAPDPPRVLRRYMPGEKTLGDPDIVALALDASGQAVDRDRERRSSGSTPTPAGSSRLRAFRTRTSMRSDSPSTDR